MTKKHLVVSYLTFLEAHYIKRILGAKSIDEMIHLLYKDMRRGAFRLHREVVDKEKELMSRQYGGYDSVQVKDE